MKPRRRSGLRLDRPLGRSRRRSALRRGWRSMAVPGDRAGQSRVPTRSDPDVSWFGGTTTCPGQMRSGRGSDPGSRRRSGCSARPCPECAGSTPAVTARIILSIAAKQTATHRPVEHNLVPGSIAGSQYARSIDAERCDQGLIFPRPLGQRWLSVRIAR